MKDFLNTPESHFFAVNMGEWFSDKDFLKVCKRIEAANKKQFVFYSDHFTVWRVPLPEKAQYNIDKYQPQVEGSVEIGTFSHQPRKIRK